MTHQIFTIYVIQQIHSILLLIFQNPSNPSKLIFGVDTGYIHTMTFKKPVSQLFETPFKNDEGVQKIFWSVSI